MNRSKECIDNRFTGKQYKQSRGKLILFLLAVPLLLLLSLLLGASGIGIPDPALPAGKAIIGLRVGRMLMGLMVGAALSASGVVFQALLRNPLAEPYVLGVSGGAGLGATFSILAGGSLFLPFSLPVVAFVSALVTLLIVYMIASQGGGGAPSVYSLILSGVIVSAIASSIIMFLVSSASVEGMHNVIWWMLGSLQPVSREQEIFSALLVVAGLLGSWALSAKLNALTLGREMAHYQGINADLVIIGGLFWATLLAATAVSLSGMIGFVGLIVPHVMRAMFGPDHKKLLPLAALGGGTFLVLCDALARTVIAPIEIPVGVVTALAGGPFFLVILQRRMKQAWIA
ncbi:FecCD family ABC transporter permease [Chlorobium phaeobacteroides]|jgi:iron complex transport system permease protein|uniref:Transport system permease protein n=1 Tax=Chlorobium phaeobacteroides (strain DSM 266 / SMG 266 / 2430) TaxID=290317 RepID=A1BFI4_CHLPD|nr:iron ABC transporter permease [Chlorobium phaeobacteroides]ABL65161.1 transport system permease protein [Chlorobium phaeobacteroides DSM 266]MBV5326840.1 iron ABC transporter permease [Chlorobium sp.]